MDTQPKSFRLVDEEECPPVFRKLETLAPSRHSPLRTGRLHIAIQGDNFFRDVKYTLTVSLLDPSFKDQVLEAEESLASKRDEVRMDHPRVAPSTFLYCEFHSLVTLPRMRIFVSLGAGFVTAFVGLSRSRVWNQGCLKLIHRRYASWRGNIGTLETSMRRCAKRWLSRPSVSRIA